eukprot:2795363-Alexandrium_andersonii.AAC.1
MAKSLFTRTTASGSTSAFSILSASKVSARRRPMPGPGPRYSAIRPRRRASSRSAAGAASHA